MKSAFVIAAALALCGSAFADTGAQQAPKKNGVVATVKQDAHQIGSSFRQDFHRMARRFFNQRHGRRCGGKQRVIRPPSAHGCRVRELAGFAPLTGLAERLLRMPGSF
jgi:hypothetical protein